MRLIEKISTAILYLLIVVPMTFAAFVVSPFMGVPFTLVLFAGLFRRYKNEV